MHAGSISHDDIIRAFTNHVPGSFVRDYRANKGFITVCRGLKSIKWRDQMSAPKVEKEVPAVTLVNLPRGFVTAQTQFMGIRLHRPGWRQEFRRASRYLSDDQMQAITEDLDVGEVFPGIV
jgi:hypothetical protein